MTGKVLVDGQPAAGAMVIFCPVEGSDELMRERPVGIVGSDGTFQLTTFLTNDGGPAGNFKVLVYWPASVGAGQNQDERRSRTAPDRLRGKYFNLDKTPLTATIEEGPTDLPPFELASR